jgi:hypothetical protein
MLPSEIGGIAEGGLCSVENIHRKTPSSGVFLNSINVSTNTPIATESMP